MGSQHEPDSIMKLVIAATALLLTGGAAFAGDFALLSMQYSRDQFVPHIRFDGIITPGDAAALSALFERALGCDRTCQGSSAVLTLNSFGGNYVEAQAIAEVLRMHHVATVIEADQSCYDACVVAFTGGSAFGAGDGIAPDRTVVPGAEVVLNNFAEPHEALAPAILAHGIDAVLGGNPTELEALAAAGAWNLSSFVISYQTGSMSTPLDLANPEGLYFMSARLPWIDSAAFAPVQATAMLDACSFLIARHERQTPIDMSAQIESDFMKNFDPAGSGEPLMGYQLTDMDDFSFCGTIASDTSFSTIALYAQDGATLTEVDSLQLEPFMLLDPWTRLTDLEAIFVAAVSDARFESTGRVFLPHSGAAITANPLDSKTIYQDKYRRISSFSDIMIYEQAGSSDLFDAAIDYMEGPQLTKTQLSEMPDITTLHGTYADSGNGLSMMAFDGMDAATVRIELGKPWDKLSAEELAFIVRLECGIVLGNLSLECE